jgi:hypothetical protein
MVGSANGFTFLWAFAQLPKPRLDIPRFHGQRRQYSPPRNDAIDQVSIVGFDGGKRFGACRFRLVDSQLVLDEILAELTKRPRFSLEGLQLVDGFAQLLTIYFSQRVRWTRANIPDQTNGNCPFDSFPIRARSVVAEHPRQTIRAAFFANTA